MQRLTPSRLLLYAIICCLVVIAFHSLTSPCYPANHNKMVPKDSVQYVYDADKHAYPYDRDMPLIFIGGVPRSGTTLMRALLDAHQDVRCGEETRLIPRVLSMRNQWLRSPKESRRLEEAGITNEVMDSAISSFVLEVIAKHGEPAPRLCNKDPFTLKSSVDLARMFPNAKFILMIRDGRATVNSIIKRHVTISGFDLQSYKASLEKWNSVIGWMVNACKIVGRSRCMPVYYEQLVLHPESQIRQVLDFLDLPWDENVLHHEQFINKPGGVSLSRTERSTDQVIKPINLEALTKWVDEFPQNLRNKVDSIAPMLAKLGYDPLSFPPRYGEADTSVAENTEGIRNNQAFWNQKQQDVVQASKPPRRFGWNGGFMNNSGNTNAAVPKALSSSKHVKFQPADLPPSGDKTRNIKPSDLPIR